MGIIPARAGFTYSYYQPGPAVADHPRSRGVYGSPATATGNRRGSSPLARGLRRAAASRAWGPRIIPARAGFTDSLDHGSLVSADHPRSRGVYGPAHDRTPGRMGSSPLARGLPGRLVSFPGRAPDHPRSRGVYGWAPPAAGPITGSSPLARGLPVNLHLADGRVGIIPARAGFTHHRHVRRRHAPDHPRSRGVY